MTDDVFRIINLETESVKRITAVNIKPPPGVVEITGRNRQGKTSLLDAIDWAITGGDHIQRNPINKDSDTARIVLDLGGDDGKLALRITRRFNRPKEARADGKLYTTSLTVENDEGMRATSPQATLDKLVGALSFDPLAFQRQRPDQQFETLRTFVAGVDFDALDKADKVDYDARTTQNTLAKNAVAAMAAIQIEDGAADEVMLDEEKLTAQLQSAGDHNATLEQRRAGRATAQGQVKAKTEAADAKRADAERYRKLAADAETEAEKLAGDAAQLQKRIDEADALPAPIDTAEIAAQLNKARGHNARVAAAIAAQTKRDELAATKAAAEKRAEELTDAMAKRKKERADAIAKAKLPIAGLGFGDKFVTLNGQPFEQASDAEQLECSVAIAAAMNPKLRVIRIRDGSLLDTDAMGALAKFAAERGYQIWVETVQSGRAGAIVIEDGRVAGAAASDVEAATEAAQ